MDNSTYKYTYDFTTAYCEGENITFVYITLIKSNKFNTLKYEDCKTPIGMYDGIPAEDITEQIILNWMNKHFGAKNEQQSN